MKDTQFVYAVSRVRSGELKLLTLQELDQLLSMPDVKSAMRMLGDRGWDTEGESVEVMLRGETEKTWSFIAEVCEDTSVFALLLLKNDFHNLKAKIKATLTGGNAKDYYLAPVSVELETIESAVNENNFELLPEFMRTAAKEAFDVLLSVRDGQLADVVLDKAQLEAVREAGKKSGVPFVSQYAELVVALTDLKIAVRARKTGKSIDFLKRSLAECASLEIQELSLAAAQSQEALYEYIAHTPYGAALEALNKSFSAFEKWCDDQIIAHIADAKYRPFGIEPLFAYILARENEIKMVRIVLSGIHNDLSKESIRERLRNSYV